MGSANERSLHFCHSFIAASNYFTTNCNKLLEYFLAAAMEEAELKTDNETFNIPTLAIARKLRILASWSKPWSRT